ncbi:MAG: substrate-binding domain-containing protein [Hadesarchaea archaeon]|nr:substrate-binding domain-containing protein [Hadesarchaea archaeon]MDH5685855.1 substrate-binding domain-containing protein [Hadesarchaea archaeon]
MKKEIVGQGAAIVVVFIIALIIGAVAGYMLKPAPPEIAELEAQVSELGGTIDDLESQIADLEAQIPPPLDTIKVAFVCHGTWTYWVLYNDAAVAMAERLRNVEVTYHYTEGDTGLQIDMIREEIAQGVDALIVSIPDATIFDAPIQEARDAGIVVIAYGCDDPEGAAGNARQAFIKNWGKKGLYYDISYKRAELAFDYVPEGGHIYFPNCEPGAEWSLESKQGLLDYFEEHGKTIHLHEENISLDVPEAQMRVTAYILAHPETDVIIPAGGLGSIAALLAEEALRMQPGELPIFSWPHGEVDVRGIQSGLVIAGVTDSPFSIVAICLLEAVMAVEHNVGPIDVALSLLVVDQSNVDKWAFWYVKELI